MCGRGHSLIAAQNVSCLTILPQDQKETWHTAPCHWVGSIPPTANYSPSSSSSLPHGCGCSPINSSPTNTVGRRHCRHGRAIKPRKRHGSRILPPIDDTIGEKLGDAAANPRLLLPSRGAVPLARKDAPVLSTRHCD